MEPGGEGQHRPHAPDPRRARLAGPLDGGKDGAHAAWALIQHADRDLDLQRRGLELMRQAVEKDEADPSDLAYLVDRVRVAEKKPQVYGTQWETDPQGNWRPRTPIENEAEVDERRADVGLKPIKEYVEELKSLE
ncbi:DUF6624 domain-containing protein [Nonomuraea turcica]|uniref:DUF6624 domain-containing protein n=1 Tax=Nonomuraea sp. G32 TaxID=3067274 RepID=UPI0035304842